MNCYHDSKLFFYFFKLATNTQFLVFSFQVNTWEKNITNNADHMKWHKKTSAPTPKKHRRECSARFCGIVREIMIILSTVALVITDILLANLSPRG